LAACFAVLSAAEAALAASEIPDGFEDAIGAGPHARAIEETGKMTASSTVFRSNRFPRQGTIYLICIE